MEFVDINSLPNPKTGKSYREENLEKQHNIPLGSLVEIDDPENPLRLYVVEHVRDFDGTPLYSLSFDKDWNSEMYGKEFRKLARFRVDQGYPEEALKMLN